jgi:hypothetical protein
VLNLDLLVPLNLILFELTGLLKQLGSRALDMALAELLELQLNLLGTAFSKNGSLETQQS